MRNVQPSSRFRVGGKAEKRLNKTEVEEILSEHFVAQVERFEVPGIEPIYPRAISQTL